MTLNPTVVARRRGAERTGGPEGVAVLRRRRSDATSGGPRAAPLDHRDEFAYRRPRDEIGMGALVEFDATPTITPALADIADQRR